MIMFFSPFFEQMNFSFSYDSTFTVLAMGLLYCYSFSNEPVVLLLF